MPSLSSDNGREYYSENQGNNFVNQLIARKLMFNWCATQIHKMWGFSELGRTLGLLLLQSGYRCRTIVLGWLLTNFYVRY